MHDVEICVGQLDALLARYRSGPIFIPLAQLRLASTAIYPVNICIDAFVHQLRGFSEFVRDLFCIDHLAPPIDCVDISFIITGLENLPDPGAHGVLEIIRPANDSADPWPFGELRIKPLWTAAVTLDHHSGMFLARLNLPGADLNSRMPARSGRVPGRTL